MPLFRGSDPDLLDRDLLPTLLRKQVLAPRVSNAQCADEDPAFLLSQDGVPHGRRVAGALDLVPGRDRLLVLVHELRLGQLTEAELVDEHEKPVTPWHQIQGPSDASTMWYAVLRKQERGIFIGTLCIRHTGRQNLLAEQGWEEIPVERIGV